VNVKWLRNNPNHPHRPLLKQLQQYYIEDTHRKVRLTDRMQYNC